MQGISALADVSREEYTVVMVVLLAIAVLSSADRVSSWDSAEVSLLRPVASSRALDGDELIRIGDLHEVQNHLQEAMPYYQRALTAFRSKGNRRGEVVSLQRIARVLERQGKLAEAFTTINEGLHVLDRIRDPGMKAEALLRAGHIGAALGQVDAAESAYAEARSLFGRLKDRHGETEALLRLGLLRVDDRADEGLTFLQQATTDARQRSQWDQALTGLIGMGDVQRRLDRIDEAREAYEEALRVAEDQRLLDRQALARIRLARLHQDRGRLEEARLMAQGALPLYQSLRDRLGEADALSLLGTLNLLEGHVEEAMNRHQRALDLYRALRNRAREAGSLANLAIVYESQGAVEQARETQDKVIFLLQSAS